MEGDRIFLSHCLLIGGRKQPFKQVGQNLEALLKSKCTKLQCVASDWEHARWAALPSTSCV